LLLSAGSAAGKKDHNNIGGTIMSNFNFKSFLTNDDGIGGLLDSMIAYWGPVMQACAAEMGIIIKTVILAIGITGGK